MAGRVENTVDWTIGHICGPVQLGHWPIPLALFLAGLGASVTHCLAMCSPFVLAQRPQDPTFLGRLLLPYHLGRVSTYVALGAAAGAGTSFWIGSPVFTVVRHLVLALVAAMFLWIFAERFLLRAGLRLPFRLPYALPCALPSMSKLQNIRHPAGRYVLGLSLGLLPCPLVYGATVAAATTGNPWLGALAMGAFGLGTTPALVGLGYARGSLLKSSPRLQDILSLAALGINGVILLALAVS